MYLLLCLFLCRILYKLPECLCICANPPSLLCSSRRGTETLCDTGNLQPTAYLFQTSVVLIKIADCVNSRISIKEENVLNSLCLVCSSRVFVPHEGRSQTDQGQPDGQTDESDPYVTYMDQRLMNQIHMLLTWIKD